VLRSSWLRGPVSQGSGRKKKYSPATLGLVHTFSVPSPPIRLSLLQTCRVFVTNSLLLVTFALPSSSLSLSSSGLCVRCWCLINRPPALHFFLWDTARFGCWKVLPHFPHFAFVMVVERVVKLRPVQKHLDLYRYFCKIKELPVRFRERRTTGAFSRTKNYRCGLKKHRM
jgi:hypothetical protein